MLVCSRQRFCGWHVVTGEVGITFLRWKESDIHILASNSMLNRTNGEINSIKKRAQRISALQRTASDERKSINFLIQLLSNTLWISDFLLDSLFAHQHFNETTKFFDHQRSTWAKTSEDSNKKKQIFAFSSNQIIFLQTSLFIFGKLNVLRETDLRFGTLFI